MKVLYYRHNRKTPVQTMEESPTSFVEMTILLSGKMVYFLNKNRVELVSGDVLFSLPVKSRAREEVIGCDYVSFNVTECETKGLDLVLKNAVDSIVKNAIIIADEAFEENYNAEDERIKQIYSLLYTHLVHKAETKDTNELVRQIKQYVKDNLKNKITLESISQKVGYSSVYCDGVFKKHTGKAIIEYVISERIRIAKSMLIEGCFSLEDIAFSCGFSDYNYFSRAFKKNTGYSPYQYKKLFV